MSHLRFVSVSALVLALAACAPEAEVEVPPTEPASPPVDAATDSAPGSEADSSDADALDPLEIAARGACAAGDLAFVGQIPEGSGFASRGPDARVHLAWRLDGEDSEYVIRTPELADEDRMAFDIAVANFMRHNLVADFDRTGLTGAFRYRDGRFCVVQTEREVVEALRDATLAAADAL